MQIMNRTGYDLAVLGNHEFDYGMERLSALIGTATAQYLGGNIRYSGNGENALSGVKPYQIVSYGDTDVAFIGVCTPENITSSTPVFSVMRRDSLSMIFTEAAASGQTFRQERLPAGI